MGATEEILEEFYEKISKDAVCKESLVIELKKLVEAGKVDKTTLRGLIEEAYPHASKD